MWRDNKGLLAAWSGFFVAAAYLLGFQMYWCGKWWGFFGLYKYKVDSIVWAAQIADAPEEQSVDSVRGVALKQMSGPVVEVFGQTRMGNGSLYLYVLQGRDLKLLLKTRAVDYHKNFDLFRGGKLKVNYKDVNGDGSTDVILTGVVNYFDDDGPNPEMVIGSKTCKKVFVWDEKHNVFLKDPAMGEGLDICGD